MVDRLTDTVVFGADLGLNRPGFSRIHLKKDDGIWHINSVTVMSVDNKSKQKNMKKQRGEKLAEIADSFIRFVADDIENMGRSVPCYFVREHSINNASFGRRSGTAARTGISETVGVMDLQLWLLQKYAVWDEIYPVTIKKQLTGNHKASKEEVAEAVRRYVGDMDFKNDDESDAVAVALAWLIKNDYIEFKKEDDKHGKDS